MATPPPRAVRRSHMATPAWSDAPVLAVGSDRAASQHEPQWVRLCKLAIPAHRSCVACHGTGQVPHQKKRKVATAPPTPPPMVPCSACSGSGLMLRSPISDAERGDTVQSADANEVGAENADHVLPADGKVISDGMVIESVDVAIIGGGIGGLALALALQQRGVRCAVYERDNSIGERSQGSRCSRGVPRCAPLGLRRRSRRLGCTARHTTPSTRSPAL